MKRVLSLLPSTTEVIYALGAADSLVAVTHECDFPPDARKKPQVTGARIHPAMESADIDALVREQLNDSGSLYTLDMELVERLGPEIVLTQQLCTVCAVGYETVHAAMGALPAPPLVINIEPRTLNEVLDSFNEIACLLGLQNFGAQLVDSLQHKLQNIPPLPAAPTLLFLEWLVPPFSAGHWIAELIEAAGAYHVLANPGEHSRQLAWKTIQATEFDTLVISCCGFSIERTMLDVEASPELAQLRAARPELSVIVFDGNHFFSRPGPRLVESALLLNAALAGTDPGIVQSSVPLPYRILA